MPTKLSEWASRLAESGWLVALLIVPIFFNPYTERIFEEDKIPLMRAAALVVLLALVVWAVERGRVGLQIEGRSLWRVPLVRPALALSAIYLLSTALSVLPSISLWGAYIRRQGLLTWLSYIVLFFALLLFMRSRAQVNRLTLILLITSVPASLYGFMQNQGLDPIPWGGDVVERVSSTAGNPIFISAYLIMVLPLTLMVLIRAFRQMFSAEKGEVRGVSTSLLAGAYLFLLLLQSMTILFSQSRGPLIGLGVGLVFFGILYALPRSRAATLSIIGLTVAAIGFLIIFNLPNSPLAPLRDVQYVGRLGQVWEINSGTGLVRTLIWEGATELIASDPTRALIGYGPETMSSIYPPFYRPELGQVESRTAAPDRSHNETLDSIVTTGVLGFVAQTLLFLTLIYYALRWLGLVPQRSHLWLYVGCVVVGGALGALLPILLDGTARMSGIGLPAGIALGLIIYLLAMALVLPREEVATHPHAPLLIALLAGVIAHFVEIHFGIAIAATRLYFWLFAALIVVLGLELVPVVDAETVEARTTRNRRKRRRGQFRLDPDLLATSMLVGLLLCVLTYIFYVPSLGLDVGEALPRLLWLIGGTWLFGALVVGAQHATDAPSAGNWKQRLLLYAAGSLGVWLLFSIFYVPWAGLQAGGDALRLTSHYANSITLLYLFVLGTMIAVSLVLLRKENLPSAWLRPPKWQGALYGVGAVALIPAVVLINLNVSRADAFNRYGSAYEAAQDWDQAEAMYRAALSYRGDVETYYLSLGRTQLEQARRVGVAEREPLLEQAEQTLQDARALNPYNPDHLRNLATLHRTWANLLQNEEPDAATAHREQAEQYYLDALEVSPSYAYLWNDYATLLAEMERPEEAREIFDRSLELDDEFVTTYLSRAQVELIDKNYEAALDYYERAAEIAPGNTEALSGQGIVFAETGRLAEAIQINERLRLLAPDDYATLKNLALLYRDSGQPQRALEAAQAALPLAPEQERGAVQALIDALASP